nr:auxilin-like protein [Tanacetum cinerariifolium]
YQSRIPLVKVQWNSRRGHEFTWEREDSFKKKYPHLFTNRASSSTTSRLAMRRAINIVDLMGLLPQLRDPQSELLLLRSCKGVILPSPKRELNLTTLSKRRDVWDTATSKGQQTPASALFSETVKDMEVHFDMNVRRAGISAKKETHVNFLTGMLNGRSILKPADILIFEWVGRKHACVDLIGVSPLLGLSSQGFTVGHAALKVASCKVTKHEKTCIENQHVFVLFTSDNFGFLEPEATELLNRVQ